MQPRENFDEPVDRAVQRFSFPSNYNSYMPHPDIIENLCELDKNILRERHRIARQEYEQRKAEELDNYTLAKRLLDDFGISPEPDSFSTRIFKSLFQKYSSPVKDKERIVSQAEQFMYHSLSRKDHRDYILKNNLNLITSDWADEMNLIYYSYHLKYYGHFHKLTII